MEGCGEHTAISSWTHHIFPESLFLEHACYLKQHHYLLSFIKRWGVGQNVQEAGCNNFPQKSNPLPSSLLLGGAAKVHHLLGSCGRTEIGWKGHERVAGETVNSFRVTCKGDRYMYLVGTVRKQIY